MVSTPLHPPILLSGAKRFPHRTLFMVMHDTFHRHFSCCHTHTHIGRLARQLLAWSYCLLVLPNTCCRMLLPNRTFKSAYALHSPNTPEPLPTAAPTKWQMPLRRRHFRPLFKLIATITWKMWFSLRQNVEHEKWNIDDTISWNIVYGSAHYFALCVSRLQSSRCGCFAAVLLYHG